jgi:hypothetical protein
MNADKTNTDMMHGFGNERDWNESYYFSLYDKDNDILSFMRIGIKPNRRMKELFCFFIMPDGALIGKKEHEGYALFPSFSAGGLVFNIMRPEKLWRLSFNGELMKLSGATKTPTAAFFDLVFETLNPVFDYRECVSGEKEAASKSIASEHLEQFGKITGSLSIDGKEYKINGLGERDHSWGVREWNAPKMWAWLNCQFNEKCALNVTKLVIGDMEIDAGYFFDGAANRPLVKVKLDTAYGKDGSPDSLSMRLTDKGGKEYSVQAEVLKKAVLPFQSPDGKTLSVMHETLGKYKMGDMTGYGIVEYLIKMG